MSSIPALERHILPQITGDLAWPLVTRFSSLVRISGSKDERESAAYICDVLDSLGVSYDAYEPNLYLSVPISASIVTSEGAVFAKCPSFSAITPQSGVSGDLSYIPAGHASGTADLFASNLGGLLDVRGKIALVDGMGMPLKVRELQEAGALGAIFVNPGHYIHEGICTTIWGTPGASDLTRKPRIPVVSVSSQDGRRLKALAQCAEPVTLHTMLSEGLKPCPVIVAHIQGEICPEKYYLLHGHLDSWHVGIGDNATGNGALLELAAALHKSRRQMARSVKIAWWTGHSTGRYAGSTWFADTFALDIIENCVAHSNCDSPGCRWATDFVELSCMAEADGFIRQVIHDVTGLSGDRIQIERPPRAGDYSFNNLGLTGFLMLSSMIPAAVRSQKGLYTVGGCGGNIEWHTEDDKMFVADRANLVRDMKVYAAACARVLSLPILPFDFRKLALEFRSTILRYQSMAKHTFDYSCALDETALLTASLDRFSKRLERALELSPGDPEAVSLNETLVGLSRILVPLDYSVADRFYHDAAVNIPPLPRLMPVQVPEGMEFSLEAELRRGTNHYLYNLRKARQLL